MQKTYVLIGNEGRAGDLVILDQKALSRTNNLIRSNLSKGIKSGDRAGLAIIISACVVDADDLYPCILWKFTGS